MLYSIMKMMMFAMITTALSLETRDNQQPTSDMSSPITSVAIRDIESLTLHSGVMTTGVRSAPIPQLYCSGMYCDMEATTIRCVNAGWDGNDVQWTCISELDPSIKFGDLNVQCEGYKYPDDPNILIGSCGLKYSLVSTGRPRVKPLPIETGICDINDEPINGGDEPINGGVLILILIIFIMTCICGGDSESTRDRDSSPGLLTGLAAGFVLAGLSDNGGGGSSYNDSWSSSVSTGYASTSRR